MCSEHLRAGRAATGSPFLDKMSIQRPDLDRPAVIVRMKELAAQLGRRPTREEFCSATGIGRQAVKQICGSYNALLTAAGVPVYSPRIDDDVLLRALRDGLLNAGGIVALWRFNHFGSHGQAIRVRWRGWDKALAALRNWLEENEPECPLLESLRQHCAGAPDRGVAPPFMTCPRTCGDLIRFRALDHAPTTENAVVFLFGAVAEELGFIIETVGSSFPDAEGRRRIGKVWRRVRIEFEHQSRNFLEHGHESSGCDLIVCWEHNWPDCPIEVLELKTVIGTMRHAHQ